jgi:hypothetical protein
MVKIACLRLWLRFYESAARTAMLCPAEHEIEVRVRGVDDDGPRRFGPDRSVTDALYSVRVVLRHSVIAETNQQCRDGPGGAAFHVRRGEFVYTLLRGATGGPFAARAAGRALPLGLERSRVLSQHSGG